MPTLFKAPTWICRAEGCVGPTQIACNKVGMVKLDRQFPILGAEFDSSMRSLPVKTPHQLKTMYLLASLAKFG